MTTRRYGDDEVREIFALATAQRGTNTPAPSESGGLTLSDLQRIGEEAGIEADRVAQAAQQLEARGKTGPIRRSLGLPVGMSRVVELPRAPTDREWEVLVTDFRTAFEQHGEATSTGGLREWKCGDVHISVEPTEHGQQLRMRVLSNEGIALNAAAVVLGVMATVMTVTVVAAGKPDKAIAVFGMFGGLSAAALAWSASRLPRWARERRGQVEAIATRVVQLLTPP